MKRSNLWVCLVLGILSLSGLGVAWAKGQWKDGSLAYVKTDGPSFIDSTPESQRYYVGDDICVLSSTPNRAPDCAPMSQWFAKKHPSYTNVRLGDRQFKVDEEYIQGSPADPLTTLVVHWESYFLFNNKKVPESGEFRYRVGRYNPKTGLQDIDIEVPSFLRIGVKTIHGQVKVWAEPL